MLDVDIWFLFALSRSHTVSAVCVCFFRLAHFDIIYYEFNLLFSNFIMKYDIEVKTRREAKKKQQQNINRLLFVFMICNDFFCSFQTNK